MSKFAILGLIAIVVAIQIAQTQSQEKDVAEKRNRKAEAGDSEPVNFLRKSSKSRNRKPNSKTIKEARANTKLARTNRRGCTCESGKCDCCVNLFISSLDVEDLGCAKFAYVPEDKGVRVDLTLNDRVVYQNEISAPRQDGGSSSTPTLPPMCAPLPRFPYIEICARFSSPSFATNGGIRFCMSMEARVQGKTVYRMDFDCMTYSGNGIVTQFPQLAQMAQAARPPSPPRSEKERKSKN